MEIWELTAITAGGGGKSLYKTATATTNSVTSEYSKILAEKMSNVKRDIREMELVQAQLDEIREMHEELTGEVKFDEDSGNANRDEGENYTKIVPTETVKRFLPDGSIMITTYEGSRVVEQVKHKPNMILVPDYTVPPKIDGSPATKLKPTHSLDWEMLFMM